ELPAAVAGLRRQLLALADGRQAGSLPYQKGAGVLKIVAGDGAAERQARRQRLAVAGIDVADLALRHGDQRANMNAVLPPPVAEVDAAAEQVGLIAGLAVEGKDVAFGHAAFGGPQLFDDADA